MIEIEIYRLHRGHYDVYVDFYINVVMDWWINIVKVTLNEGE